LLRINTEREIVAGQAAIRQPDSNIFRSWEIAGASHVDYWFMTYRQALVARDRLAPFNYQCDKQPLSHVNNKYVLNAGYDQLVDWILRNRPPSVATPIVVNSVSPTDIPRDTNGLVFGGIRLATVEVPTATNDGVNGSTGFCKPIWVAYSFLRRHGPAALSNSPKLRRCSQQGYSTELERWLHTS
jgi:hypothetical protein